MTVQIALLIRHGETDYNREHRLQGTMPVPLNDSGRAQAAALASHLRGVPIDALYASPIRRALETAQIIGAELEIPLHQDIRLREIEFGIFEGMTYDKARQQHPEDVRNWDTSYLSYKVPGGESRRDVQERMRCAWDEITTHAGLRTVAIVTHGSAIALFIRSLFAHPPDEPIKNSSITTLVRKREIWEIAGFSETPHLKA